MATKTINLKMVLDRSDKPEAKELRQALWTTHEQVNKAVAEIERILLLCRGRSYFIPGKDKDNQVKAENVRKQAIEFARKVQLRNEKPNTGTDDEIIKSLEQLYEALVPTVLLDEKGSPKEGTAQQAKPYCTPLMLKGSKGGKDAERKIVDPLPKWVDHRKDGTENWEQESVAWINSKEGKDVLANFDKKSSWIKLNEGWQDAFIKDQEKQRKKIKEGGIVSVLMGLEKYGLIPLFSPPIKLKALAKEKESVGAWNQLSFKKAIEHLLTWESWNHRCEKDYAKLSARVSEKEDLVHKIDTDVLRKIEKYQSMRQQELKKHSLATDKRAFKINPRMLRAAERIKEAWSKKDCTTQKAREDALAQLQTELKGKFGDPDLYLWLAQEDNVDVWKRDENPLFEVAQLNVLRRLLENRKQQSLYTQPDAVEHPKWAQFEAPGGTNLKNYALIEDNGALLLKVPLLVHSTEGICEKDFTIRLAQSGQINDPAMVINDKTKLTFFYADEQYAAELGGSDILFNRPFLENRDLDFIRNGNIGPVWFKLILDIKPKPAESDWLKKRGDRYIEVTPDAIFHFKSGLLNKKHKDSIKEGLRVLTVDLGVRTFASCSVFELIKGRPEKGLYWLADEEKDLWAKHERSFVLTMPGDEVSAKVQAARYQAYEELSRLKQGKKLLRSILRLSVIEDVEKRTKEFDLLCGGREKFTGENSAYKLSSEEIAALTSYLKKPIESWRGQIVGIFNKYEIIVSNDISKWRAATRPKTRDRKYEIGKSYWGIEYLEEVRDFLKGWSTHAREYGQITRWDRESQGTFANSLLGHINNKKEDRIKTGSDLIIQSARGKVYNEKTKKWEDKFQPCRLILFEDLAMYRFRTDRPRRENSQLMRWSHRAIYDESIQQAAIYGIHIDTTGAGFSSKFYARNGCPGIRAKKLTQTEIDYISQNEHVKDRLAKEGFDNSLLREGNLVPWQGGEFFVSFSKKDKLEILHADINAAQSLQRRFWTRYLDTFRVPVIQVDQNGNEWVLQSCGERLKGGLTMFVGENVSIKFIKDQEDGFRAEAITGKKPKAIVEEEDSGLDEFAEELMEQGIDIEREEGKGKAVFFRDASGIILRSDRFYDSKEFWGRVHRIINKALKEKYEPNPF